MQRQLDQQMKQNAGLVRMMSNEMGVIMRLSERGGVRTSAASAEGSVRSRDPAGPMSGNVPGRQDPDGASSRGSLASGPNRAGVGGVVPAEVGPRMCVCVCGHHFQQTGHQPGMVGNPARGQLNRENGIFPFPVRA